MKTNTLPTVAIVGRPNIGKSSLFNIIIGRRMAIVHEESGVTRDRIISPAHYNGQYFQIADTGGLGTFRGTKKGTGHWDSEIRKQVEAGIESAELVIMMVDITEGVTPLDKDVIDTLRRSGKPLILAANKADTKSRDTLDTEFTSLGIEDVFAISCMHRRGINALMDTVVEKIDAVSEFEVPERPLRIAVAGRPNVGKSSLVNRVTGEDRVMVSNIAGTTRDAVDIPFKIADGDDSIDAILVDTAGLRKRGRANTAVEVFSIMRAESAVKRADIVLLVIEADEYGSTAQDKKIAKMIESSGKGCIIVANKWDLCKGEKQKDVISEIYRSLPFLRYAPVVCASAETGYNFPSILDEIMNVKERMDLRVPTPLINRILHDAFLKTPPPLVGRRSFKIYYTTMADTAPPQFLLFVNDPKLCPANYLTYLKNTLRRNLDFTGWPIELKLRKREKPKQTR